MSWKDYVDILEKKEDWGKLQANDFAADIWKVAQGRGAPEIYRLAHNFFRVTYVTESLREFMTDILKRLSGDNEVNAVIELLSSFGGGKTHSLLTVYHLLTSPEDAKDFLKDLGWSGSVPNGRVAVFNGAEFDTISGTSLKYDPSVKYFTPWSLIFAQLVGAKIVEKELGEYDREFRPPSKTKMVELLERAGPSAILIDEVALSMDMLAHPQGGGLRANQVANFMQILAEAVGAVDNCVLVYAIPEKQEEIGETSTIIKVEEMRQMIKQRLQRVTQPRMTLTGDDIYGVIRKRLFSSVRVPKKVIDSFMEMYQRGEFPQEVKEPKYQGLMEKTYPFHPYLIETVQTHFGSRNQFQRTRDMLRLLTYILRAFNGIETDLITLGQFPLDHPIISSFVGNLGIGDLKHAMQIDITDKRSKAKTIDQRSASSFPLAQWIATSIFIRSLHDNPAISGSTFSDILLGVALPEIKINEIHRIIEKLKGLEGCYYLHVNRTEGVDYFRFLEKKNLISVLNDTKQRVDDKTVDRKLEEVLREVHGNHVVQCILNVSQPDINKLPDNESALLSDNKIRLVFPGIKLTCGSTMVDDQTIKMIENILNYSTSGIKPQPRRYRNSLAVILADRATMTRAYETAKELIAIEIVEKEYIDQLTIEDQERLKSLKEANQERLPVQVLNSYTHIFWPDKDNKVKHLSLAATDYLGNTLADRIVKFLEREHGLITPRISAGRLIDANRPYWNKRSATEAVDVMAIKDIWLNMCAASGTPRITEFRGLWTSIRDAHQKNMVRLFKEENPHNAKELKFSEELNDVPTTGGFGNYYLVLPSAKIFKRCKECAEWVSEDGLKDNLCFNCTVDICPRCRNQARRKEITPQGCPRCKGKEICETCKRVIESEEQRGEKCIHCIGKNICKRCGSTKLPEEITEEGCPSCRGKKQCRSCGKWEPKLEQGLCWKCEIKPESIKKPKCLSCGREDVPLENNFCQDCRERKFYKMEIDIDLTEFGAKIEDLNDYILKQLLDLNTAKGKVSIRIELDVDGSIPRNEKKVVQDIRESFEVIGGKVDEI